MKSWTVKYSPKRGKKHYHHVHPCSVAALDKPCCHIFFCWSQACFTFCKWRVLTINGCFALWKYQTEKSTRWMSNFRRCAYLWRIAFFGHHHHHHQSLNREGCWGTTYDFTTNFLHFSLFSTALWDLAGLSIPWCCLPTSSFVRLVFFPLSLCLARWFWQDLMNGKHDHTTAVCVSSWSSDLRVVQFPAGSWHGLPRW